MYIVIFWDSLYKARTYCSRSCHCRVRVRRTVDVRGRTDHRRQSLATLGALAGHELDRFNGRL